MNRNSLLKLILGITLLPLLLLLPQILGYLIVAVLLLVILLVVLYIVKRAAEGVYRYYRAHVLRNATDYRLEGDYLVSEGMFGEKQRYFDMVYSLEGLDQKKIAELFYSRLEEKGISEAAEVDIDGFGFEKIGDSLLVELGKKFPPRMEEIGLSATEENIREFLEQISEKSDIDITEEIEIVEVDKSDREPPEHTVIVDQENELTISEYLPRDFQMKRVNDTILEPLDADIRIYRFGNSLSRALTEEEAEKIGEVLNKEPILKD